MSIRRNATFLVLAAASSGCALMPGRGTPELPARMTVCETYTVKVCGTWTRQAGDRYAGTWEDGATGELTVRRPTSVEIVAQRTDQGKNPNLTAEYRGSVRGRTAAGQVTWTDGGATRTGFWTAEW